MASQRSRSRDCGVTPQPKGLRPQAIKGGEFIRPRAFEWRRSEAALATVASRRSPKGFAPKPLKGANSFDPELSNGVAAKPLSRLWRHAAAQRASPPSH